MTDKNKIINDMYHHPIIGHGSIKSVYKEAKSIDSTITLNDVKESFQSFHQNKFSSNIKDLIHLLLMIFWNVYNLILLILLKMLKKMIGIDMR